MARVTRVGGTRPLERRTIVVTRAAPQAQRFVQLLEEAGARVLQAPTIAIEPPQSWEPLDGALATLDTFTWVIFTSVNGVVMVDRRLSARGLGWAAVAKKRIAAIGPATAQRIKDFRLKVDLQPEEFVAESLAREFKKEGGVENLRILIARAEKARDLLPKELSALGAIVDEGFAYRTVPETRDDTGARRRLLEEGADLITFTSSSTVENFLALELPWPAKMQVASIGPITSKTARDRGLKVAVEARRHDIPGLVESIRKFFSV